LLPDLDAWLTVFERNAAVESKIPWETKEVLTNQEYNCIKNSVAAFQLGEYSEGKRLIKSAKKYARVHNVQKLVDITLLFIKEEQNHSFLLKRFMEKHDIPVIKKNWTDSVFRKLRKNVGYELAITVLITAEIIALTYYKALNNCTSSIVLKAICEKNLKEESVHVEYESRMLNYIRSRQTALRRFVTRYAHRSLFFGTMIVVYFNHKQVLISGGYNFSKFKQNCHKEFLTCFE
jgi:tRNA isopentenyl-2-thiomethyl-A-37 hydroxylase MiaE